jgi:hypothetical protein
MTEEEKRSYILELDEKLLKGGIILSEWPTFLAKDAEEAFCLGANLASILAAQAAIESHLRFEHYDSDEKKNSAFHELIENSDFPEQLKNDLHLLRRYRNKWVHVKDPNEDLNLLEKPSLFEEEIEAMAKHAMRVMLGAFYQKQFV